MGFFPDSSKFYPLMEGRSRHRLQSACRLPCVGALELPSISAPHWPVTTWKLRMEHISVYREWWAPPALACLTPSTCAHGAALLQLLPCAFPSPFLFFPLQAQFVVIQSGLHRVIYWQNLSQNPAWNQAVKTAESVNNSCRQYDFFM